MCTARLATRGRLARQAREEDLPQRAERLRAVVELVGERFTSVGFQLKLRAYEILRCLGIFFARDELLLSDALRRSVFHGVYVGDGHSDLEIGLGVTGDVVERFLARRSRIRDAGRRDSSACFWRQRGDFGMHVTAAITVVKET